jgi:hypothetical protein
MEDEIQQPVFISTPVMSNNPIALNMFLSNFTNKVDLVQGRAAVEAYIDEEGGSIPYQPAIGDTNYWYSLILTRNFDLTPSIQSPIEIADPEIVSQLCGVA